MSLFLHQVCRNVSQQWMLCSEWVPSERESDKNIIINLSRIWLPLTTLQLHITYGLHLPSCTALTHSHPPLHQSHNCHQSLINPDCFTTPHSHTHTYKQHTSMHTLQSLVLAPADISERLPSPLIATSVFDPGLPDLGTLNLCL